MLLIGHLENLEYQLYQQVYIRDTELIIECAML